VFGIRADNIEEADFLIDLRKTILTSTFLEEFSKFLHSDNLKNSI